MSEIKAQSGDDVQWDVSEDAIQDPEEIKVLFHALDSYLQYAKVSHFNCTHLRRQSFYAMSQEHWKMLAAPPFNYLETLDKVDDAIEKNAELAREIVRFGLESFRVGGAGASGAAAGDHAHVASSATSSAEPKLPTPWAGAAKHQDVDKARSTLRQFYRDWSAEGAAERAKCYGPVFKALDDERQRRVGALMAKIMSSGGPQNYVEDDDDFDTFNHRLKVLVPGAGLGRLVFDLCCHGYESEGNEISYHQLLASSYILNYTQQAGQHEIFPWAHSFSNHKVRSNHLRSYKIPDIHPGTKLMQIAMRQQAQAAGQIQVSVDGIKGQDPHAANGGDGDDNLGAEYGVGSMSMCAADFLCLYSDAEHAEVFDAVACVFFLDTAPNLIRYLETIRHCLKPGGLLVNVGPLLWHFENNAPGNHGRDDDGDGEHDVSASSGIADPGSFELSDDEVKALVEKLGFTVISHETGVETPYIHDSESMLQTVYRSSSWVARKPFKDEVTEEK